VNIALQGNTRTQESPHVTASVQPACRQTEARQPPLLRPSLLLVHRAAVQQILPAYDREARSKREARRSAEPGGNHGKLAFNLRRTCAPEQGRPLAFTPAHLHA